MAKWSNRAAVLWLLAVIQAYYFLTSDGSEDGVYAGTGRMLSRLLVGESATTKDSPSVTPVVVIPSQPVQSVSIDVNGDYVLVDCVQTCKECTSPTDQYLDVDKLEVVSDCDGCLADTVCYQVDGDASKQQCLMENGGLQVHHPTVYIGEAVAQNATHGKDLDKPRFSSPLTMICQKEANAEPTVGLSRAPTSYLMQATATLDHEQKQERQQSAGLCVDNAGNVQLTSIGGYDMEHHDSPLLWTKNMAAYDDYTAESPIASSSSTASTGYSVGIRHIYGAIVGGNNLNKGQNAGTAALVRASQGSLSLVHLEGFDDAYIAPDDNSALIDTTRPVSFLHTNYARAFKTLFTSICGLNYEEKGIILPETIVSYASFPTIFLQLESHLNHEGVGVPTTLPGFVGKKHDADHPYDVLLAIRPEHYLHIDWESRVALPTIHFSSKQSSIGLDALKQHTIVLDVTHKRIGLAQQQACVPIGAIEKGKGNNMDWYAAGATTGAATGLGRFGNGLKKEKTYGKAGSGKMGRNGSGRNNNNDGESSPTTTQSSESQAEQFQGLPRAEGSLGFRVGPGAVAASEALGGVQSSHLGFDVWHLFGFIAAFIGFGLTALATRDTSGGGGNNRDKTFRAIDDNDPETYKGGVYTSSTFRRRPVPKEPKKDSSYPVPQERDRFYPYTPADRIYTATKDDKTKGTEGTDKTEKTEKTDMDDGTSFSASTIATNIFHDSHNSGLGVEKPYGYEYDEDYDNDEEELEDDRSYEDHDSMDRRKKDPTQFTKPKYSPAPSPFESETAADDDRYDDLYDDDGYDDDAEYNYFPMKPKPKNDPSSTTKSFVRGSGTSPVNRDGDDQSYMTETFDDEDASYYAGGGTRRSKMQKSKSWRSRSSQSRFTGGDEDSYASHDLGSLV